MTSTASTLTIGRVARQTGLSASAIRFYEGQGLLPPAARTDAGYRVYTPADVLRLRLIHRARLLGLPLSEVRTMVEQAFASDCIEFAAQLIERIGQQRAAIDRRIAQLSALRAELDELERHVRHNQPRARPGQRVAECGFCPLIDEEGGEC
jgi:DNA-binding transcriptional MerR regulator